MILADTSAWIEYDRATESAVDHRLTRLVEDGAELAVTDLVRMELLIGVRDDQHAAELVGLMLRASFLPFDSAVDFDGAVAIHRRCRAAGLSPGGSIDCMIASVAIRHGAAVLANDVAFARMAEVVDLALDDASLR